MAITILSKYEPNNFDLASQIITKISEAKVILLSDALYFALDERYKEPIEKMRKMGVIFYSLESDFAKRDLGNAPESVKIVNYEELVKILIENGRNTINL